MHEFSIIDLHCHSSASDGALSPTEVVEFAVSRHLKVLALTDHDTIDGIPQAARLWKWPRRSSGRPIAII